jgi:hypothetical protein
MLLTLFPTRNAVRIMVSTIGVLCGIIGMEHGFFEVLQGYRVPQIHLVSGRSMIYAIGEANRFWQDGIEPAVTLIPNYLITGILAMIVSLLVTIWAAGFVHKQYGWLIFILLSILQYLVGGGAAQIGLAIVVGLVAICINRPFTWGQSFLSLSLRQRVAKPWFGFLLAFCFTQCMSIITAIFGWFFGMHDPQATQTILFGLLYVMMGLLPLTIISAMAHDSVKESI